jgi:ribosomal protein L11 methyltransferase
MGNYIQISINPENWQQSEILMAGLSDSGYEGFLEEENSLHAYISEAHFDEGDLRRMLSLHNLHFSKHIIKAQNWNEQWEKSAQPVRVGDFCTIRPHFHPMDKGTKYDLIITPKMSFGTGHHATTFMMVEFMKDLDFKEKKVLDFGTGTGVLAILAEKMGASEILAIDQDELSIQNASENVQENDCHRVLVSQCDRLDQFGEFDIILANLNKDTILRNLPDLRQHLALQGVLILSGLLVQDMEEIERETRKNSWKVTHSRLRENWVSLQLEKCS